MGGVCPGRVCVRAEVTLASVCVPADCQLAFTTLFAVATGCRSRSADPR